LEEIADISKDVVEIPFYLDRKGIGVPPSLRGFRDGCHCGDARSLWSDLARSSV